VKRNRHTKDKHKRHDDLSRGSAKSNDQLEYHGVLLYFALFPFARNLHNLESLTLTIRINMNHKSKGGKQHTQIHSKYAHTHKSKT
jgi:hypothetical protein